MVKRNPEGKVQDGLMEYLNSIVDSFWVKPTTTNKRGTSDIIGDIQGHAVWIEVKKGKREKPNELQAYRIERALARGSISFYTASIAHCKEALESFCKAKHIVLSYRW